MLIDDVKLKLEQLSVLEPLDIKDLLLEMEQFSGRIHLPILHQPYLDHILSGEKTIESRFMNVRQPPYGRVNVGDVMILKESSGSIKGLAEVEFVIEHGPLDDHEAMRILEKYRGELCVTEDFINSKANSRYAVLIGIGRTIALHPVDLVKKDRRAWVIF